MSYYLEVEKNNRVTYSALLNNLQFDDVKIAKISEEILRTEIANYYKFYIPNKSSRGVQVGFSDNNYEVIINVFASEEDYFLATKIAIEISKITKSEICPEQSPVEGQDTFSADQFKEHFNLDWAKENSMTGVGAFRYLIKDSGTITISGCFRNVYIGKELLDRYETKNGEVTDQELYEKIIHRIRMVQFLPEHVFVPNEYEVTEEDDSKWSYITLTYDYEQLIKKTEYIIFHISKEEYFKMDFEKFQDYCKLNFKRLDEEQYLMPKHTKTEFIQLMAKFGYNIPNKFPKDKWWKFW